jgi:hypothetical protein
MGDILQTDSPRVSSGLRRSGRWVNGALLLGLASSVVCNLPCQAPTRLLALGKPLGTCTQCALTVVRGTDFGDANDEELIPEGAVFTKLPGDRLLVGQGNGGVLFSFSSKGHYERTLGRLGDGPGEYRDAVALLSGPRDSATVLGSNAFAVISIKSGQGRSKPVSGLGTVAATMLPGGNILLNTSYGKRPAFLLMNGEFKELASFGPTLVLNANGDRDAPRYVLCGSRQGGFWSAKQEYVHRIQRWSLGGQVLQQLDSVPSWYTPYTVTEARARSGFREKFTERPLPRIRAIREDASGKLWILTTVADPNWAPVANVPLMPKYSDYLRFEPPSDPDRHLDTIIEIFDAKLGTLLGAWRVHQLLGGFLEDGLAYRIDQDKDGINHLETWRVSVRAK